MCGICGDLLQKGKQKRALSPCFLHFDYGSNRMIERQIDIDTYFLIGTTFYWPNYSCIIQLRYLRMRRESFVHKWDTKSDLFVGVNLSKNSLNDYYLNFGSYQFPIHISILRWTCPSQWKMHYPFFVFSRKLWYKFTTWQQHTNLMTPFCQAYQITMKAFLVHFIISF